MLFTPTLAVFLIGFYCRFNKASIELGVVDISFSTLIHLCYILSVIAKNSVKNFELIQFRERNR